MGYLIVMGLALIIMLPISIKRMNTGMMFTWFIIGIILIMPLNIKVEKESIKESEMEIYSFKPNVNPQEKLFLEKGESDNANYLYYTIKDETGYRIQKVNIESSIIKEVDDDYKVEIYKLEPTSKSFKGIFFKWFYGIFMNKEYEYVFSIPKDE